MGKQIFILKNQSGNAGIAKIINNGNRTILSINLKDNSTTKKTCYITSGESRINVGTFYKKRTEFEIQQSTNIDNIIIEENGNRLMWCNDNIVQKENENPSQPPPKEITFEDFFGGGFVWHRIRGNFIMFDYSIIHHILSMNSVYRSINKAGYYCAGIRKDEDITIIAIAIPVIKDIKNPFSGVSADIYNVKMNKIKFDVVCVGIDKTGEFFICN